MSPIPFGLDVHVDAAAVHVAVRGEIDLLTSPQLLESIQSASASGYREVVVDLSAVEFMDSTGLDALLQAKRALRASAVAMRVQMPSPAVALLLDTTGTAAFLRGEVAEAPPAAMAD